MPRWELRVLSSSVLQDPLPLASAKDMPRSPVDRLVKGSRYLVLGDSWDILHRFRRCANHTCRFPMRNFFRYVQGGDAKSQCIQCFRNCETLWNILLRYKGCIFIAQLWYCQNRALFLRSQAARHSPRRVWRLGKLRDETSGLGLGVKLAREESIPFYSQSTFKHIQAQLYQSSASEKQTGRSVILIGTQEKRLKQLKKKFRQTLDARPGSQQTTGKKTHPDTNGQRAN